MVQKEILDSVRKFAKALKQNRLKINKLILYGSRVTGESQEYSDIDIAVVSHDFGRDRFREALRLRAIASNIDVRIEPVPIPLNSYEEDTWVPLIHEIRTKGLEVK
jgi:predicted nucleotidyltransferase